MLYSRRDFDIDSISIYTDHLFFRSTTMTQHDPQQDIWKQQVGEAAAELVEGNMLVGLGTGSTANQFIRALGHRVQQGLRIAGAVASSQASHDLATSVGIPVADLDTYPELDIYVDGADEIDPQLH